MLWQLVRITNSCTTAPSRLSPAGAQRAPVYWCKSNRSCDGADHVVFNSYVDTPEYGDERAFVDAKPAGARSLNWFNVLHIHAGEHVTVRIYVDNDAWNARGPAGGGIAVGTRLRVDLPLAAAQRHYVYGYISAANATPRVVWDGVTLVSDTPTVLRYTFGSGQWWTHNRHWQIPDALMEDGTPVGSRAADGRFGDELSDSGLLTFEVRVVSPSQAKIAATSE